MSSVRRLVGFGQLALASLSIACTADGPTYPNGSAEVGPIGPFPTDLTGKVAFATEVVRQTSTRAYIETKLHVIDIAAPEDRVIYTAKDLFIEGLSWAPDGEQLVMQTFKLQDPGPNGENRDIWELYLLGVTGSLDQVLYPGSGPKVHPAYSADRRLAYFAGWGPTTGPDSQGIYINGQLKHLLPLDLNNYLSWLPDGSGLVYSSTYWKAPGLVRLTFADSSVTQLVPPDSDEVITQPDYSPDGARIVIMRFGGSHKGGEIWTVTAAGTDAQQLTTGPADAFPSWTPGGKYIAFARPNSASGIYLINPGGGTPTRIVGVSAPGFVTALAWSR